MIIYEGYFNGNDITNDEIVTDIEQSNINDTKVFKYGFRLELCFQSPLFNEGDSLDKITDTVCHPYYKRLMYFLNASNIIQDYDEPVFQLQAPDDSLLKQQNKVNNINIRTLVQPANGYNKKEVDIDFHYNANFKTLKDLIKFMKQLIKIVSFKNQITHTLPYIAIALADDKQEQNYGFSYFTKPARLFTEEPYTSTHSQDKADKKRNIESLLYFCQEFIPEVTDKDIKKAIKQYIIESVWSDNSHNLNESRTFKEDPDFTYSEFLNCYYNYMNEMIDDISDAYLKKYDLTVLTEENEEYFTDLNWFAAFDASTPEYLEDGIIHVYLNPELLYKKMRQKKCLNLYNVEALAKITIGHEIGHGLVAFIKMNKDKFSKPHTKALQTILKLSGKREEKVVEEFGEFMASDITNVNSSILDNAMYENEFNNSVNENYDCLNESSESTKWIPYNKENIEKYKSDNNMLCHARTDEDCFGWIVIKGNKLVGYCGCQDNKIIALEVMPEFRRRKYAKKFIQKAKDAGCTELSVEKGNRPAISLYFKNGFYICGSNKKMLFMKLRQKK